MINQGQSIERRISPLVLPTHAEVVETFLGYREAWHDYTFAQEDPIYEQLTSEYIGRLAGFLTKLALSADGDTQPARVLEIGAGAGRLSHWLGQAIQDQPIEFIATDSGAAGSVSIFPVIEIDYKQALAEFCPDMVLCSWMPYMQDWSVDIRNTTSVQAYVLIGETRFGCVGADETWNPSIYEADGFVAEYIDCGPQINRMVLFDYFEPDEVVDSTSHTVVFRREVQ